MSLQSALLKEGTRHLAGVDEALLRNIEAVRDLAKIVRTSLGPLGMNKMVINSHQKLFVTNDASTILQELDVFHPAAKLVVMNSKRQAEEYGDFTNFVIVLAGDLLTHAESLLRMGLHATDVIKGYRKALKKFEEIIEDLSCSRIDNVTDVSQVQTFIRTSIMSKQYGYEDDISRIVSEACISTCESNPKNFNVDNVRTIKIEGGGVSDMKCVKGIILQRGAEGIVQRAEKAKIAVFSGGIDFSKTESKDTFLITSPEQLEGFQKAQEDEMEKIVNDIAKSGAKVIVCNGTIGTLAMHYMNKIGLMVIKVSSKFDIVRISRAVGARPCVQMSAPQPEELGYCDEVYIDEIGGKKVCVFNQKESQSKLSTIIIRGATENILNDIERAVEDGVNTYKALVRDPRFLSGAGSFEIEASLLLKKEGDSISGQEQYAFKKFAEALEVVPRSLAESSGHNATLIISKLYAEHSKGNKNHGIDLDTGEIVDVNELKIYDHLVSKKRAVRLATEAAINILSIDQILMAKTATGPKVPPPRPMDED